MASNSPIVMPLKSCCIAKVNRLESHQDCEGNLMLCSECGTFLTYDKGAWKVDPKMNICHKEY